MTTIPDETNVLYNFWTDKNIPDERKIRYTWEEVYESKKHSDDLSLPLEKRGSERYKKSVMQEISKYGLQSEYVQTQYYVSFASRGRKFTTIEDLRRNNVFRGGVTANNAMEIRMEMNNSRDGETIDFVVAGFDPATDHDKAAFSVGILTIDKKSRDVIKVRIKNVHILNDGMDTISPATLAKKAADVCDLYKVDMVMVDATANQKDRSFYLYKELKLLECDTLVIPYSYGGTNKQVMMGKFEDCLKENRFELLSEEERVVNDHYNEGVRELLYLQKVVTKDASGRPKIEYYAPKAEGYYDDVCCSWSQLTFIGYYLKMNLFAFIKKRKMIDLGDGIEYPLDYHINMFTRADLNKALDRHAQGKQKQARLGRISRR